MKTDFAEPLQVISQWIEAQQAYANIPAISAGVVAGGELIWSDGFGYANLKTQTKATDSTIYSICSISKLFTAIAVMQLRDQGLFDLDDALVKHLPWFQIEQAHPKSAPITIRSILTHASGLPRESDFPYWTDPEFPFPTQEQFQEKLLTQKTARATFAAYGYSNLGIALLGQLIAEKSDVPYTEYVRKNILEPLNLADTRPELPISLLHGQLATGYSVASRAGLREELASFQTKSITPAAGFSSTVKDLAKFACWQFKTLEEIDDPILSGHTLSEMQRVHWLDPKAGVTWGLGFGIDKFDTMTTVGHSGGCPGYLSQFVLIPEKKWAFIVMVNGLGIDTHQYALGMFHILNLYESEKAVEPSSSANLEEYCGAYHSFWDGEGLVVPWKGKLASFSLRSPNQQKPLMVMQHVEGDIFRRIGDDGNLEDEVRFERAENGKVVRFWHQSQYISKI